MDQRRAAGLLLALAACIATAIAAPTSSNHTSLDLYDGAPEGCYYNFQHYGEGHRIMTNEPCLNCTCHNRMLMCYLRVCPFTKPIGQDCTVEKRADQCCPIVTCPDVPVDLLTSTTTSPAEYGSTGIGKLDKFGCSINGKFFPEGAKVPPTPNKPCEHCYCIRNMTTCVMQECTLHVDGCTPIYHKDVCCPVRYSCDHPEDELPALDDLSTTVRPTPGFLLTTTTLSPVTQMSQDCVYDNRIFADGALIETEKACDHCYCMKGDIVCVVQACGTPMENEGKNCTALPPREGVCCPDTYICEGDEPTTGSYGYDVTTKYVPQDDITTLEPPRRTISEGSGYRNEPDNVPSTKLPIFEPDVEGSGEEEPSIVTPIIPGSSSSSESPDDDILATTEDVQEYIPLTTSKTTEYNEVTTAGSKDDKNIDSSTDSKKLSESTESSTTNEPWNIQKDDKLTTEKTDVDDFGSGEEPEDKDSIPPKEITISPQLYTTEKSHATTEQNEEDFVTTEAIEEDSSKPLMPITSGPIVQNDITTKQPSEYVTASPIESSSENTADSTQKTDLKITPEEISTTISESIPTTSSFKPEYEDKENIDSTNPDVTSKPTKINEESHLESHEYLTSTSAPSIDDEFVTTESELHENDFETEKSTEYFEPQQHITASTLMLEEIEKETTDHIAQHIVPSDTTQNDELYPISSTVTNLAPIDIEEVTKSTVTDEHVSQDDILVSTNAPTYDQPEVITVEPVNVPELIPETSTITVDSEHQHPTTIETPSIDDNGRRTTQNDLPITIAEDNTKPDDSDSSTSLPEREDDIATTEPDKGLNTIPSDFIDEESPISSDMKKTTAHDETITTESNLINKLNGEPDSLTTSSTSITSEPKEGTSTFTTESSFTKDSDSTTESQVSPKLTTVTAAITEEVMSSQAHDHTKSTESSLDHGEELKTTVEPKYTEKIEETALPKETTSSSSYPDESTTKSSITEQDESEMDVKTEPPVYENLPETSTVNEVDNEIINEPRIPGEGDCLLNGVTYTNDSAVPSSNKCESGCKCVSSIIKCDPIICSPPPEYMNNCETMYDAPDACCPTYICDHKTETKPPQSHSQMSGTEAPVSPPIHCQGDECELNKDKKDKEVPSESCVSGNCGEPSDDSQGETKLPSSETIPEQSTSHGKEQCTNESECKQTPDLIPQEPKPCLNGADCTSINIPIDEPKKECKEDNCIDTDSSTHEMDQEQCSGPGCIKNQGNLVTSTASPLEQTSHDSKIESTVMETEKAEESEKPTEPSPPMHSHKVSEITEHPEIVTEKSEIDPNNLLTVTPGRIEPVTYFESLPESTTTFTGSLDEDEFSSTKYVTDQKKPESTDAPSYSSSVSIETSTKQYENDVSSESITTVNTQEFSTPMVTKAADTLMPDDTTKMISEENFTELPINQMLESQTTIKPSNIEPDSIKQDITGQITTEIPVTEDKEFEEGYKAPDNVVDTEISTKPVLESGTEPSKTYTTELPQTSKLPAIEVITVMTSDITGSPANDDSPIITEPTETTKIEKIDSNLSTDNEPSTELPKTIKPLEDNTESMEPSHSDKEYHDITTSKTLEESITEPSRRSTVEQEFTKPAEEVVHDDTTIKTSEVYEKGTSEPTVTVRIPEEDLYTTSDISNELVTEPSTKVTELQDEKETISIVNESTTKSSITLDNEPKETTELPGKDDEKIITTNVPLESATEPSTFVSEAQGPYDSENIEPIITTIKTISDLSTEPSKLPSEDDEQQSEVNTELPDHTESDKEFEHTKTTKIDFNTEGPHKDEKSTIESEITETYGSGSTEATTPTIVSDTKINESENERTTSEIPFSPESPQDNKDQVAATKQDVTTPVSTKLDTTTIVTPDVDDSQQVIDDSELHIEDKQKPNLDIQTTDSSTAGFEKTSPTDSDKMTQSPDKPFDDEKEIQDETDVKNEVSEPTDELRTTSSEMQFTTPKSIETTKPHYDTEIKTEYPKIDTTPQLVSQNEKISPMSHDKTTEDTLTASETPISDEKIQTELPDADSLKTSTVEPISHESEVPVHPIDSTIESQVTEQYDMTTKESDVEIDSKTPASETIETDKQENDKDDVTTQHSETTVFSDPADKLEFETSTEHDKSSEGKVPLATETTTIKEHLTEKIEPEINTTTDSIFDHKVTTEYSDVVTSDSLITNAPEAIDTFNPITERNEKPSETTDTEYQPSPITEQNQTEMDQENTKAPSSETTKQETKQPESVTDSTAETIYTTKAPTSDLDNDKQVTEDRTSTEITEANEIERATTLEPAFVSESTAKPFTESKHEYSESSSPSIDSEQTDTITTGSITTESSDISPTTHRIVTDNLTEEIKKVTPEEVPSDDKHLATVKPTEAEVHETTLASEEIPKMSTLPPVKIEEKITTVVPDISQTSELTTPREEQLNPVDSSDVDKTSEPADSVSEVQTERATPTSHIPLHETTGPEEEFIMATSKATTALVEEESTSSPSGEKLTESTEKPSELPSGLPEMSITTTLSTPTILPQEHLTTVSVTKSSAEPEEFVTHITTKPQDTSDIESLITTASAVPVTALPEAYSTLTSETLITSEPKEPITTSSEEPISSVPETTPGSSLPITILNELPNKHVPEAPITSKPGASVTTSSEVQITDVPEESGAHAPEAPVIILPETTSTAVPETPITSVSEDSIKSDAEESITSAPKESVTFAPKEPITSAPKEPSTDLPEEYEPHVTEEAVTSAPKSPITAIPEIQSTPAPEAPVTDSFEAPSTIEPSSDTSASEVPIITSPEAPIKLTPESAITSAPEPTIVDITESGPEALVTSLPNLPVTDAPEVPSKPDSETLVTSMPEVPVPVVSEESSEPIPDAVVTSAPETPDAILTSTAASDIPIKSSPEVTDSAAPETPSTPSESPITIPESPITTTSITKESEVPETKLPTTPESSVTIAPEAPASSPELPKPVSTEAPTDEVPTDEEASFPTGGTSGYGQETDYGDEDQTFGPGTCRYGGKVYVSAQQIPRDDPCDFCFCFRSDIICLQQSCPPPIHGCHEEPIQGFCCPRYECPVSMATTVNVTTTTTTTTTTLPPNFPTHSYKGSVQKRGCQIKGQTYKVGEVVRASSGPCLHCTCGGDGQMKCDPKVCTPEPMLRQMIAAAVSAKRRR